MPFDPNSILRRFVRTAQDAAETGVEAAAGGKVGGKTAGDPTDDEPPAPKKQLAAIQNCLPKRLRLLGEGGRELQLSPLERRGITQEDLLGFEPALVAARDQQFVKLLYKWSGRVEDLLQTVAGLLMIGAFGYDHTGPRPDHVETLALLAKYNDLVAPLVTHTYTLDQANEAFATALDKRSGAIKVAVLP